LIEIRHDIGRHPEVCFEDTRTAVLAADRLRYWGGDRGMCEHGSLVPGEMHACGYD
jgi:metal-dependent amidase/aminoacylase/carboxypeptidase family protein